MSIEKKSLISTLNTTKKANVASSPTPFDSVSRTEVLKKTGLKKTGLKKTGLKKTGLKKTGLKKASIKMD